MARRRVRSRRSLLTAPLIEGLRASDDSGLWVVGALFSALAIAAGVIGQLLGQGLGLVLASHRPRE